MTVSAHDVDLTTQDDRVSVRGVSPADLLEALGLLEAAREIQAEQSALKGPELVHVLMSTSGYSTVPSTSLLQAQRLASRRDALLATPTYFYSSLAVVRGARKESSVRTSIARQRERCEVFDVSHDGRTILPAFQFDSAGQPRPELQPLIEILSTAGVVDWALWAWLTTPSNYLSGGVPEKIAATSLERATRAAERFAASHAA